MNKKSSLNEALEKAEQDGGTITYHFEDKTNQVSTINKELFINEKGRKRSLDDVASIIRGIQHDLGAKSFTI